MERTIIVLCAQLRVVYRPKKGEWSKTLPQHQNRPAGQKNSHFNG